MPVQVTEEEIQAELEEMKRTGRHHTPKSLKGSFFTPHRLRVIVIGVLLIALSLAAFVWISGLKTDQEGKGYIINILDDMNEEAKDKQSKLQLSFDPKFDPNNKDYFDSLVGLGYGNVGSLQGGSMMKYLGTNETMFRKFQTFSLNDEIASEYEGNEGQYNFDEYYANKYFLKNMSETETIEFRLNLKVTQNINGALHAARFMIVTGKTVEGEKNLDYKIFATPNKLTNKEEYAATRIKSTSSGDVTEYFTNPQSTTNNATEDFNLAWLCEKLLVNEDTGFYHYTSCDVDDEGNLVSGEYYKIGPGETLCYTICVWFEGSDPDHNNSIIGGGISFSVDYETKEYVKYWTTLKKQQEVE